MDIQKDQEQAFSEGYKKAYDNLIIQGWPKRKATRYLNSVAARNFKKFTKKMKKDGQQGTVNTDDLKELYNNDAP